VLKLHESIGENRVKFATAIQEVSEDVSVLYKETDKTRKIVWILQIKCFIELFIIASR